MNTTRPELIGTFGMVASTHWLASAAGMAELEAGGNAVDAAVAAGFVLQVAEPHLNGPGGDMTLLLQTHDGGVQTLCGQGPAPAAATPAAMRDRGLDRVPGSGIASTAVPGSTLAWLTLLRDHGTRSLAQVLRYAIGYARTGIPVLASIAKNIANVADLFERSWPTSAEIYLPGGAVPAAGSLLANPALADTYEVLVSAADGGSRESGLDRAIEAWSQGPIAEAMLAFSEREHDDGLGRTYPGLLSAEDLALWRPGYEQPVQAEVRGWTVHKAPAWSQGPVLLQQLLLLDALGALASETAVGDAAWIHTITEAGKLALADRDAWYGDPENGQVPMATLLSREYAQRRAALVGATASPELRPGSPEGRAPRLPSWDLTGPLAPGAGLGDPTVARGGAMRGDTCHVSVTDASGLTVAATPSGGWLASSPVIPELGFPLGTRLQMTTLEPGLPATLRPGGRPRTTLTPTIARHQDGTRLAFGTPGGDQQDQWQVPFFLRLLAGANLQEAIDAPTFHSNHVPSSFFPRQAIPNQVVVEESVGEDVLAGLAERGHDVTRSAPWTLGRLSAVSHTPGGAGPAVLRAAANPRGMQGYAVGR